ncbi:hypothetical protein Hanom_Chr03g00231321 [Helianthus anomalus]
MFAITTSITLLNDSGVATALCGDKTTLSSMNNSFGTSGSFSNTSRPAPPSSPPTRNFTNSFSSTRAPRPILTITPFFPRAVKTSRLIMWRVLLDNAQQTIKESLLVARSRTVG